MIKKELKPLNWISRILLKYLRYEINIELEPVKINVIEDAIKKMKKHTGNNPDYMILKNENIYFIDSTTVVYDMILPRFYSKIWDITT